MKKITFLQSIILLFMIITASDIYAQDQLIPAGFYRMEVLGDFDGENLIMTVDPARTDIELATQLASTDNNAVNQVVEVFYTGEEFNGNAVFNIVGASGVGNIEAANEIDANTGERSITANSQRARVRGATSAGNEAGVLDNFYLEVADANADPLIYRIRSGHTEAPNGNEVRLQGAVVANENSPLFGRRFMNYGGNSPTDRDLWTITEVSSDDPVLSTSSLEASSFFISNPVSDVLNIASLTTNQMESIAIYSVIGEEVVNTSLNTSRASLDTSSLSSGVYILKIKGTKGLFTTKIIKK